MAPFLFNDIAECQESCGHFCEDVGNVDFGLCDFPLGIAIVNGECTSVSGCDWVVDEVDYSSAFFDSFEDCENSCFNSVGEGRLQEIKLYPVPFEDVLQMAFDRPVDAKWKLVDLSGRTVRSGVLNHSFFHEFHLGDLSRGSYILEIEAEHQRFVRRVIKE
jgi:hypothetical protein